MSNHSRDYDKIVALLKSVAAPCESHERSLEHSWRKCRHCLAVAELERPDIRQMLRTFLEAVAAGDAVYGKTRF